MRKNSETVLLPTANKYYCQKKTKMRKNQQKIFQRENESIIESFPMTCVLANLTLTPSLITSETQSIFL